ncbi:MAG TPA: NYN domain-containing protein [Candidatus Krumholzibacteria bacterium]|nr:NYN domain-containing protein [Candidatus Krumholzibacteria bacterium]
MPSLPKYPRAIAFFDGQNLYHGAKEAFGYQTPNYDALALAGSVCARNGWLLSKTRFYTGIHNQQQNPELYSFWSNKIAQMKRMGITCFTPTLKYRPRQFVTAGRQVITKLVGVEKGVDVRIALDIVRLARQREFDVAVVFSQDQDLAEAAKEIRSIARDQDRWIKIACAYPCSPQSRNQRGINSTDWIRVDKDMYDACIDLNDYR